MSKSKNNSSQSSSSDIESVRIDKWVWAARFAKTRSLAKDLVQAGKIQYNGQRSKPSRVVEIGATIKVPSGYDEKVVVVTKIYDKRQSAPIAQTMFEETAASIEQREKNAQARQLSAFHSPKPDSRPDKKQRRQLIQFKQK